MDYIRVCLRICDSHLSVEVYDLLRELQLKLTRLEYGLILGSAFNCERLATSHASLRASRSSDLCQVSMKADSFI